MISANSKNVSDTKFKSFEINKIKNILKKRDFCDRQFFEYKMNNSSKQATVNLSTVAYEALKNNTIFALSDSGDVTLVRPTINSEDLDAATVETQYFLQLCVKGSRGVLGTGYRITMTFYHTNSSISIQSYQNDDFLLDGRTPAHAFLLDYLAPALEFIKTKIDVKKESFLIKEKIN